jgi:hypothetical protein
MNYAKRQIFIVFLLINTFMIQIAVDLCILSHRSVGGYEES